MNYVCYTKTKTARDLPIWRGRFRTRAAAEIFAAMLDLTVHPSQILSDRATSLADGIQLYLAERAKGWA